jgi:hypothetical protein
MKKNPNFIAYGASSAPAMAETAGWAHPRWPALPVRHEMRLPVLSGPCRCAAALLAAAWAETLPAEEQQQRFSLTGDLTAGYQALREDDNDGGEHTTHQLEARPRIRASWMPEESLSLQAGIAGRFSSLDNDWHAKFYTSVPDTHGLQPGQSTVDLLNIGLRPGRGWEIDIGRLQTAFELQGLIAGSLDRNDSPTFDITWTDGAHVRYTTQDQWKWHLILQRNLASGPTNVRLPPLDFTDSTSRVSYFAALEKTDPEGFVAQRGLDINYLPASLDADGSSLTAAEDYSAVVVRGALQWALGNMDGNTILSAAAGYAPDTPLRSVVRLAGPGDADGFAWQAQLTLKDFYPGHSFGIQHGAAGAGWLISADFLPNTFVTEVRYAWEFIENQEMTISYRYRKEKEQLIGMAQKWQDHEIAVRYMGEF